MEILKGKAIKIERELRPVDSVGDIATEIVAHVPAVSGEFVVDGKQLTVTVCPTDASNRQKVIFEGEAFPTINVRGGRQRQLSKLPARRRVLNFPADSKNKIRQQVGENESLLFSYVPMSAGRAGD